MALSWGFAAGAKSLRGWGHNRLSLCGFCANTAFPVNQLQAGNKALFPDLHRQLEYQSDRENALSFRYRVFFHRVRYVGGFSRSAQGIAPNSLRQNDSGLAFVGHSSRVGSINFVHRGRRGLNA